MQTYTRPPDFTLEYLHSLFEYDALTGNLTRKFPGGGRAKGAIAGYLRADGYTYIRVGARQYLGHILVWYYTKLEWPKYQIDHINGIKNDNRIENLRDVSQELNQQNQKKSPITNKSCGLLGVSKSSASRWRARITIPGGIRKSLGTFSTPEEAHIAYLKAKSEYYPELGIVLNSTN